MFHSIDAARPGFLTLPHQGLSPWWFVSTVLLSALGFYMWPHTFSAVYSARSPRAFRRNAVYLPLYQLILLFVFFAGFAAVIAAPGLKGADGDLSLLKATVRTFDPWFVGVVGGAGLLTALVPGSLLLMNSATSLARNVLLPLRPRTSERTVGRAAKLMVPVLAALALLFTFNGGGTIVNLLLMGYALVTQLFPPLLFALAARRLVTKQGAAAGILAGVATVAVTTLAHTTVADLLPFLPQAVKDFNIGVIALVVNTVALLAVSAVTRPSAEAAAVPATGDAR
jgi:SSS family solute:Na+ symporter